MQKHFAISLALFSTLILVRCGLREKIETAKNFRFEKSISVDGLTRTYILNLPPTYYEKNTFSLIIAMHGGGGSAKQCESAYDLTEKANTENYVIVYPEGVQSDGVFKARTWNAGTCCDYAVEKDINDVKYIGAVIDELVKNYQINPKKVFATGMSNGAMLAYRLACEIPEKITAIAPVAGTQTLGKPCNATKPIPILHFHSVLDLNVMPNGGKGVGGNTYPSILAGLTTWGGINQCKTTVKVTQDDAKYKLTQWLDCQNNAVISYYLTKDGGHSWPGGVKERIAADDPSKVINANDLMFAFFGQF